MIEVLSSVRLPDSQMVLKMLGVLTKLYTNMGLMSV